jgi:hypothetical protein
MDPCCFFSNIYLNRDDYLKGRIDKELFDHELEHVRQSHTIDIILIELLKILYWFNPVHILYDRAIRINHELLADNEVLRDRSDIEISSAICTAAITDEGSSPVKEYGICWSKENEPTIYDYKTFRKGRASNYAAYMINLH